MPLTQGGCETRAVLNLKLWRMIGSYQATKLRTVMAKLLAPELFFFKF